MKTNPINPNSELNVSGDSQLPDLQVFHKYSEQEHKMASGGSSQVLGDFFEFTDYLIPVYRSTIHSTTEDYYSALNSL